VRDGELGAAVLCVCLGDIEDGFYGEDMREKEEAGAVADLEDFLRGVSGRTTGGRG
jgi:hypothetical protein